MISISQAVSKVEKITESHVKKVSDFKSKYYLLLVEGGSPYYIVDKNNGDTRFLNPMEDFAALRDSLENKVLKVFPNME